MRARGTRLGRLGTLWREDESLADSDNLPPPEVIAQEIVDDLAAALEPSRLIAGDLNSGGESAAAWFGAVTRHGQADGILRRSSCRTIIRVMGNLPFDPQRPELGELCRRYGVRRLDLFGSAATGAFDPERSDLDFLVEFDTDPKRLFDRYFGLKEALEALFGRPVDLVSAGASGNPYFVASVNQTRRAVYAAEDAEAA